MEAEQKNDEKCPVCGEDYVIAFRPGDPSMPVSWSGTVCVVSNRYEGTVNGGYIYHD